MFSFLFSFLFALASATVYFSETFPSDEHGWVQSTVRPEGERGAVAVQSGRSKSGTDDDKGLQTIEDARFYTYSKTFPEFSNDGKTLVLQYTVKSEQGIDCGGAYLKLHPAGLDQEKYTGDSVYNIMFGPDICGHEQRTHFILNNKGKNHLITNNIPGEFDRFTHTYTLIIKPDNSFQVLIDGEEKRAGKIEDEFEILEPKKINDPEQSKPKDWVDDPMMDDPEDKKPEGYDDIPATIVDPEAKKPEDWDDELDGEWEAPTISNPAFKGPWRAKRIENPAYKGPWVHPQIDNPKYQPDDKLYSYSSFGAVGLEIWQVKSGSVFDEILITDDAELAASARTKHAERREREKEEDKKVQEEERKKREEEEAKAAAEGEAEKDDDKEEL
jgi:calreticulin